jgi:uncharacterized protein YycO
MITIVFVKRPWWNPIAALIRWAIPMSRFRWARSSHSMILDGDHVIHATMLHGVVRQPISESLHGQKVVEVVSFSVPDASVGIDWAFGQIGKPYDFAGAFGLSLSPDRRWQEDDKWFCHELCASAIQKAGRNLFIDVGHVTDSHLLLIQP